MKTTTCLIPICLSLFIQGCAWHTTKSIPITKVIQVSNNTKNELFVKANIWMVDTFKSAKSVIQFSDKESGTISGRYLLGMITAGSQYAAARYAYAAIKIRVKNGASKITITPESFEYPVGHPYTLYTKENVEKDVKLLLSSYAKTMQEKTDDNW